MTQPESHESHPDPHVAALLARTLEQVREAIGPQRANVALPAGSVLVGVLTEIYQSPTLESGRDAMPGTYAPADRSLVVLSLQQDREVFLVGGRLDPADSFAFDKALGGGVDPRDTDRLIYTYDGGQTITEYLQNGEVHTYTGENGNPYYLAEQIRDKLGACVASEVAGDHFPQHELFDDI